jgi:hypothetical protein
MRSLRQDPTTNFVFDEILAAVVLGCHHLMGARINCTFSAVFLAAANWKRNLAENTVRRSMWETPLMKARLDGKGQNISENPSWEIGQVNSTRGEATALSQALLGRVNTVNWVSEAH